MKQGLTDTATSAPAHLPVAWRLVLFLVCIPSGGAVLAEVYGLASLHDVVWLGAIPGYGILVLAWIWSLRAPLPELADALAIGSSGGLLATFAYDVARIPFVFAGYRIFAQNSTYGLWILDAELSSRFTETAGWLYHFANGITFGIMYALFMRGRHWAFAIGWAFLLETIALVSPYGAIYHITQSPALVVIAYYGHVAYGLPLGFMVERWSVVAGWLRTSWPALRIAGLTLLAAAIIGPLTSSAARVADANARVAAFAVTDEQLAPDWLRLRRSGSIVIRNGCAQSATILVDAGEAFTMRACEERSLELGTPGIHQFAVKGSSLRTRSSFVLVEPIYQSR